MKKDERQDCSLQPIIRLSAQKVTDKIIKGELKWNVAHVKFVMKHHIGGQKRPDGDVQGIVQNLRENGNH
jgi:hypothetical protein